MSRQNISYLKDNGPTPVVDLPYAPQVDDRVQGLNTFRLSTAAATTIGGRQTTVAYLTQSHTEVQVLRVYFQENEAVLAELNQNTLHQLVTDHGSNWRAAANQVIDEFQPD